MKLRPKTAGRAHRARLECRGDGHYHLIGSAGFGNAGDLLNEGRRAFADGPAMAITVDLSSADCANSAGLALLLEWSLWCGTKGIELEYSDAAPALIRAAAIHGVGHALPLRRSANGPADGSTANETTASPASGRHREGLTAAPALPAARR